MDSDDLHRPTEVPEHKIADAVAQASFPARPEALAEHARSQNLPENVVESLRRLPDHVYDDAREVEDAYESDSQRGGT